MHFLYGLDVGDVGGQHLGIELDRLLFVRMNYLQRNQQLLNLLSNKYCIQIIFFNCNYLTVILAY